MIASTTNLDDVQKANDELGSTSGRSCGKNQIKGDNLVQIDGIKREKKEKAKEMAVAE